jgi:hypothetical protein
MDLLTRHRTARTSGTERRERAALIKSPVCAHLHRGLIAGPIAPFAREKSSDSGPPRRCGARRAWRRACSESRLIQAARNRNRNRNGKDQDQISTLRSERARDSGALSAEISGQTMAASARLHARVRMQCSQTQPQSSARHLMPAPCTAPASPEQQAPHAKRHAPPAAPIDATASAAASASASLLVKTHRTAQCIGCPCSCGSS